MNNPVVESLICLYQFFGEGTEPYFTLVAQSCDGKNCSYDPDTRTTPPSESCRGINFTYVNESAVQVSSSRALLKISIMRALQSVMCVNVTVNDEGKV